MKKHITIALVLVASILIPLTAATKSSKTKDSKAEAKSESAKPVPVAASTPSVEPKSPKSAASSRSKSKASGNAESKAPKLPAKQVRARSLMAELTSTQKTKLLAFLNESSIKELAVVKGISTTRAAAINQARPFDGIDEVILVKGIGEGTFAEVVKHGKTLTLPRTASSGDDKTSSARKSS